MNVPSDDNLPGDVAEILKLAGKQENGVPKGLIRCSVCGDWIGRCLWPDPLTWHKGPTRVSCRCEANLYNRCGEPIYTYRLGANIYDEDAGKVLHIPGMIGALHGCGKPRIELPCPIQPFWDDKYAPVLAGFPVELVYIGVRPRNDETRKLMVVKARYCLDLETYFETDDRKEVRYHSVLYSSCYVDVIWQKSARRWVTFKCKGNLLLFHATGRTFEEAMRNTLTVGLDPCEPAT